MRHELRQEARLEHRLKICLKLTLKHPNFPNALKGTKENVEYVANYMQKKGMSGILFGGCAREPMLSRPRKDIDVLILRGPRHEKFEEGVDWWNPVAAGFRNGNGAIIPISLEFSHALDDGLWISRPLTQFFYSSSSEERFGSVREAPALEATMLPGRKWELLPNGLYTCKAKEKELKAIPREELNVSGMKFFGDAATNLWNWIVGHIDGNQVVLVTGNASKWFCHWAKKVEKVAIPESAAP